MIAVENVYKHFGGVRAVDGVSLVIAQNTITGLIGPNGAGKTTLFNVIAGMYRPDSGTVRMADEEITGLQPHELFGRGLLRTFQIAHEFPSMTVRENLMMVPAGQSGERLLSAWFRPAQVAEEERTLPIRLTPMTATCRVPPLSRVKLGIGWSRGVARDAEQ